MHWTPQPMHRGRQRLWVGALAVLLLSSCARQSSFSYVQQPTGQSVRELDVQSVEVMSRVPWPEKVVSSVGTWSPCPGEELDAEGAVFELDMALDGPFEVLERGAGQEAIFEEWRQQMSGLVREDQGAQWGNLEAADGVVVLDVTCVREVQRYKVSISDVASGRRAFMRSFAGGDVFDAMHLLGLELGRQYSLQRHPLDGVPEYQLRHDQFDLFEVDEVSAMAWRNEVEDVVERAIRSWQPLKRVNLLSSLTGELTLDPNQGSRTELTLRGTRGAALERHLNGALAGMSQPAIPMFGGIPIHAKATIRWPFSYSHDPAFIVDHRKRARLLPEVVARLANAPTGRYAFEMSFWQLGEQEEKRVRLLHGETRSTGKALLLSALMPGSGLSYVTYGEKRGAPYLLAVAGSVALSWLCFEQMGRVTDESLKEDWGERGTLAGLAGLLIYGTGILQTYEEAMLRQEAMEAFLEENADRD